MLAMEQKRLGRSQEALGMKDHVPDRYAGWDRKKYKMFPGSQVEETGRKSLTEIESLEVLPLEGRSRAQC